MTRSRGPHFLGALTSKLVPPLVQLAMLLVMARIGSIEDVGRLALASATAFMCGSLGEFGFGTTLSAPRTYFGTDHPPIRSTRRIRIITAISASALYGVLWSFGLGGHDPRLLLLLPLPYLLALSYGYAGALNAESQLHREGLTTIAESAAILLVWAAVATAVSPLAAAFVGITAGRAFGTWMRVTQIRPITEAGATAVATHVARSQGWFALLTIFIVIYGQIDIVVAGGIGAYALIAVFSPLIRSAYSATLFAEALSWSLYGKAGEKREQVGTERVMIRFIGNWGVAAPVLGLLSAIAFALVVPYFVSFLLNRHVDGLFWPVLLLSAVILMKFASSLSGLRLTKAGVQRPRIPVVIAAIIPLVTLAAWGAHTGSITLLALGRASSELVVLVGYSWLAVRCAKPAEKLADNWLPS